MATESKKLTINIDHRQMSSQIKILLIEDDEDDYILVRDLLAEMPLAKFALDWAPSFDSALAKSEQIQYDVYLLDYRLGSHDGLELLQVLKDRGHTAPIIFLTGQGDYEVDVEAMKIGAADYLIKTQINAPLLERSIRYAIERKHAEKALQENEQLLRTVLETLPVGVLITDKSGKIKSSNPAARRIWGGKKHVDMNRFGEYKGWWSETGKKIEATEWALARAILKGEISIGELIDIEAFDGSHRTIINSAIPIKDPKGHLYAAIGVNEDITELKRTEQALRASEQRFRTLIESMNDTVFTLDKQQRYSGIFGTWFAENGLATASFIGKRPRDVFAPLIAELHETANEKVLQGENIVYEWVLETATGPKTLQNSLSPIYDAKGKIQGIVCVARDITDQKLLEKQLLQTEKLLAVGEMSAMVAHEFRNALTSIRMLLELEMETKIKHSLEENSLSVAMSSINHMESVVTQLLNFAKPTPMTFEPTDLNWLIDEAIVFVEIQLHKEGITLTKTLDDNIGPVMLDSKNFKEAIINLLLNAIQAIAQKEANFDQREISVSSSRTALHEKMDGSYSDQSSNIESTIVPTKQHSSLQAGTCCLVISIQDSGCGIEPQKINQIFNPFFTTKMTGTGLGLPVVKRIIEAHNGIIKIKSQVNKGTQFEIFLPIPESECAS
jgi:PAS domain S-box-containing protein